MLKWQEWNCSGLKKKGNGIVRERKLTVVELPGNAKMKGRVLSGYAKMAEGGLLYLKLYTYSVLSNYNVSCPSLKLYLESLDFKT